jgi:hypothetical protein
MVLKACAALTLLACSARAQNADSQVRVQIRRVRESLQAQPVTDPRFKDSNGTMESLLKAAEEAAADGRLYLSLEKLVQVSDLLQGVRNTVEKTEAVKGGLDAFDEEWRKASAAISARGQAPRALDWTHMPAAIRALAEVAQARTVPLLEGARGFAVSTKPEDGLFYVGEARAQAEFVEFCAGLHSQRAVRPVPLRSILPELLALQQKANDAFQPPRSIELHPRFIALNSTIKLARELDASKSYAGALYQYLDAVRHYAMLSMPTVDAAKQAELKEEVTGALHKLEAAKQDDSILQILLQRAASQVAHDDASAPGADEWKSAQAILQQVVPAYQAALKSPAGLHRTSGKTIDLTVVRWPYT